MGERERVWACEWMCKVGRAVLTVVGFECDGDMSKA